MNNRDYTSLAQLAPKSQNRIRHSAAYFGVQIKLGQNQPAAFEPKNEHALVPSA
jgi:hypothetical protein